MKAGYKRTEVGVIPEDWESKSIDELATVSTGGTPSRATQAYWNGDIPWVTTSEIDFGVIHETRESITKLGMSSSPAKLLPSGTLLMAMYGQGKTRGKVAVLGISATTNQACAAISWFGTIHPLYVFYNLASRYEEIRNLSNIGNQENLNLDIIKRIHLPLPPLPEQRAIAAALGDVDAQIAALDALIRKQRDVKQAAMQQLLTGKTRLPGFEGEWEVKRLDEIVEFLDGKRKPIKDSERAKMQGGYPYYGASGIIDYVDNYIFDDDLILLGEDGENIVSRNLPLAFRISGKVWINNHAHVLKPKDGYGIAFLTEYLESLNYENYNTGTAQPKLNKAICSQIPIACPRLVEQDAIAAILSDIDAEIAALERKCDKARAIKHGMLQELLTGQTRLV